MRPPIRVASLSFLLLLPACGGGGGGSSAPVPVTSFSKGFSIAPRTSALALPDPGFAPEADYFHDPLREEIEDPALVGLRQINTLLDAAGRAGSDALVNTGAYGAQIRLDADGAGVDTDAARRATGRSSAWAASGFEVWTLDRSRPAGGAQSQSIWVPRVDPVHGPLTLFLEADLTRNPQPGYPFGEETLNFSGAADVSALGTPFFVGSLSTFGGAAGAGFSYFESSGDLGQVPIPGERFCEVQASVVWQPGDVLGSSRIFRRERFDDGSGDTGILSEEWLLAFDATHVLRGRNGLVPQAFFRANPTRYVWRYGMYEASGPCAGERVHPSAGFGVRTLAGERGWYEAGELWFPTGVVIANGETLLRDVFGETVQTSYNVLTTPGRLTRMTRRALDLARVDGERFQWFEYDAGGASTALHEVAYQSGAGTWSRLATFDDATRVFIELSPPEVIDVAMLGALNLHSDALGGQLAYVAGSTFVNWYDLEIVDGSDAVFAGGATEFVLSGFMDGLRSSITSAEAQTGDVYLAPAPNTSSPSRYVFMRNDLTLYLDVNGDGSLLEPVTLGGGQSSVPGPYAWGLKSGALLPTAVTPVTVAGAWNEDVLYQWETGAQAWNRFTGLTDTMGDFVEPTRPVRFEYVHTTANDRNADATHDGRTFVLEWSVSTGVRGIPRRGLDQNADGRADRWLPVINLVDGLSLGPAGSERVLKALLVEEKLRSDPAYGGVLALLTAGDLVVPTVLSHTTPAIGAAPAISDPPLVVDGQEPELVP